LLALACVLVIFGMVKGLVRILIGLAALAAAFVSATRFHEGLAARLPTFDLGAEWLRLIAYVLIFLGVLLLGGAAAFVTRRALKAAMLGWADRLGGAALGLLVATLAAGTIVLPLVAYLPTGERLLGGSTLAPYVSVVSDLATRLVPAELSDRYRRRIEDLRRQWRDRVWDDSVSTTPRA